MKLNERGLNTSIGSIVDLQDLYQSYTTEFPENERKSLEQLKALMATDKYRLILLRDGKNGERIGYSFIYVIEEEGILWLDYIVIEKKFQGKGYGSYFFNGIIECFMREYIAILIEIEIPIGEDKNQVRRLKFYQGLGALPIDIKYMLPTRDGGFPMYLYYKPLNKEVKLSRDSFKNSIKAAYNFIHSDIDGKEALFNEVIASLR